MIESSRNQALIATGLSRRYLALRICLTLGGLSEHDPFVSTPSTGCLQQKTRQIARFLTFQASSHLVQKYKVCQSSFSAPPSARAITPLNFASDGSLADNIDDARRAKRSPGAEARHKRRSLSYSPVAAICRDNVRAAETPSSNRRAAV
jgi:hypothetical protein